MPRKSKTGPRREDSLTRDRIIEAAIELLDTQGEDGLTFRALAEKLATGAGAIYWHIDNKSDLVTAACETIVTQTLEACIESATPKENIRALSLGVFDAIDAHPWVGSALTRAMGQQPILRIVERIGQQVRQLVAATDQQWAAASALLHYILGVSGQNAANTQYARSHGLDRSEFLEAMSIRWSQLDPIEFPFTRSVTHQLRSHDDRADYLAGIDLILAGIGASRA